MTIRSNQVARAVGDLPRLHHFLNGRPCLSHVAKFCL